MSKYQCKACRRDTKGGTFTGPPGHWVVIRTRRLPAAEVCMDCFIFAHIPRNYVWREKYVRGNATCCPPTGVAWLDQGVNRMRGAPPFVFLGELRLDE